MRTLHYHAGEFYLWTGTAYKRAEADAADLRALVYGFLEAASERRGGEVRLFKPSKQRVDLVLDALRGVAHLKEAENKPPCWLDERKQPNPIDLISLANGVLDVRTRNLLPHDPKFFATNGLGFAYDPKAPPPKEWLKFLASVWPKDRESIATLRR